MSLRANPPQEQVKGLQPDESHPSLDCRNRISNALAASNASRCSSEISNASTDSNVHQTTLADQEGNHFPNFSAEDGTADVHVTKDTETNDSTESSDPDGSYESSPDGSLEPPPDSSLEPSKPHSSIGFTAIAATSGFMKDLGRYSGFEIDDRLVREVEGIVALFVNAADCQSIVGVSAAIFGYCRSHMTASVSSHMTTYLSEIFSPQSTSEDEFEPDWISMMRNVRTNWQLVKGNRLFSELSRMLGLLVTFRLCSVTDVTFSVKDYTLIEPDMKIVHGAAIDIIDAAFGTVTFFVENIYEAYHTRSLMPFLCSDKAASELEEEYSRVVLWWELFKNGNLKKVANRSEAEFDRRLEGLCTQIKNLLTGKMNFEKKILQDKYMKLLKIKNDYITRKIGSGVRKAPFAIELYGESSQGKTMAGDQLVDGLLKSAGLPIGKDYRASYNPSDQYMSTWTTDKLVMMVDDISNEKSNFVQRPPTRVIIDLCNNQPYYANMADLESKGKVFVEPAIVVASTNVKDLDAYTYSNCPYSVQRRMKFVLTVKAKDRFQFMVDGKPQGIDSEKVDAYYETLNRPEVFDDIWEISVEKAVKPDKLTDVATYEFVSYRGQVLEGASFRTVLQFLVEEFEKHERNQERILQRNDVRQTQLEGCPHPDCRQIRGFCDLHDYRYPRELDCEEKQKPEISPDPPDLQSPIDECSVEPDEPPEESEPPDEPGGFSLDHGSDPPDTDDGACTKQAGEEMGEVLVNGLCRAGSVIRNKIVGDVACVTSVTEAAAAAALVTTAKHFSKDWDWICILPNSWVSNRSFQNWLLVLNQKHFRKTYLLQTIITWPLVLGALFSTPWAIGIIIVFLAVIRQILLVEMMKKSFRDELMRRNSLNLASSLQAWRDTQGPIVCKALGIVGVLYSVGKLYRKFHEMRAQGSLEPVGEEEIAQRDSEVNDWIVPVKRALPMSLNSKCISTVELSSVIDKNLVYGTLLTEDGRKLMANALFIRSNVVVIPSHYFESDELKCTFRKAKPEQSGGKFPCILSIKQSVQIPNSDLRVCYAHSGGSFKNLTKWLPLDNLPDHEFTMMWRKKGGEMVVTGGRASAQSDAYNGVCKFAGGKYEGLGINTFPGLCGAILLSHGKGASISGIHVGGRDYTSRGVYAVLTADNYECAEQLLRQKEGVIISGDAENFNKQCFGINVLEEGDLHPKSPLNWMPLNSQIAYHGPCPGKVTSHTDVKVTKISPYVMEVCGEPNIWRGPKMKPEWFGWQTCLANMSLPAIPFKVDILEIAIKDYKSDLLSVFERKYIREITPLTDHESLCGRAGVKFIDSIKLSTSIGFPLTGAKRKFIIENEPTEDRPNNREFEPIISEEIARCLACYQRGERAYTVAKACKKDEVLAKDKCRIFYGNPIALTFLVRKFYLPIIRVLQLFPLRSECAVGINSHGPEWQQFHDHVYKFGGDRIIGGDYGKYDQKLSSQLLFASLRILIDFARVCNYTEEDLRVMEAMTGDIVYAVIAYNGDLISLVEGSHISGNSLTVILNGICGSLNLRCAFYTEYKPTSYEERIPFRKVVAVSTYGDDNIGSVSKDIDRFNIETVSKFLGEHGQTYTMPDKESQLMPFLKEEDFEFLKRKSVYCPKKGVVVGALIEKSIFKMLHCYMYSKKCEYTEEWACAQNIDTALREWENHGEIVYEKRRAEMKEVCSYDDRIRVLSTRLEVPYSQCVEEWKIKYDPSYVPFSEPDDPLID